MRSPAATPSFRGYVRPDGSVGTRNLLLVVSLSDLANDVVVRIGRALPKSAMVLTQAGGLSFGKEALLITWLRSRVCANPNVGAVLAVGPIPTELAMLTAEVKALGRDAKAIFLLDHADSQGAVQAGIRVARHLTRLLASARRRRAGMGALCLGIKSSTSSAESMRLANPAVGKLVDRMAGWGGSIVVPELADLCGCATALIKRSDTPGIARAVAEALEQPRRLLRALGSQAPDPTPMNVTGGLDSIARKSRGALKRLGRSAILSVMKFGDRVPGGGMHLMTGPGSSAISLLGLAAAGCTVIVHTVGLTGATAASPLVPMIKIGGPRLRMSRDVDLCITDRSRERSQDLNEILLRVASGSHTASERAGERSVMLPSNLPPL